VCEAFGFEKPLLLGDDAGEPAVKLGLTVPPSLLARADVVIE
jgi:hypothetical protein